MLFHIFSCDSLYYRRTKLKIWKFWVLDYLWKIIRILFFHLRGVIKPRGKKIASLFKEYYKQAPWCLINI